MVRETAKQKREREAAEVSSMIAEELKDYPKQLMNALHRASGFDARIEVNKDHKFVVSYIDEWGDNQHIYLPTTVDTHIGMWPLNELTRVLDRKDEEVAEAKRKAEIRKSAIAKLTDEERAELGIGRY